MSARLMEVTVPDTDVERARQFLQAYCVRQWQEAVPHGREKFSGIVLSHMVEPLLAELNDRRTHVYPRHYHKCSQAGPLH